METRLLLKYKKISIPFPFWIPFRVLALPIIAAQAAW